MGSMALSSAGRRGARGWQEDSRLAQIVAATAAAAHRRFPDLGGRELAMTLVLPNHGRVIGASLRGHRLIYPASVVKLFYLVAVQAWLEAGKLRPTAELRRALASMIGQSSNDATNHIVDLLTGTTSGPEMSQAAFTTWLERRRSVNRYFATWRCPEFAGINLTQKTWSEAPYGRERRARYAVAGNRNQLSTDSVARLLLAIARGQAVN